MDRHNLPSHTPRGARYSSGLPQQEQLDGSGQESLVPEWSEVPSPYCPEQPDPDSDALWLPLREPNHGAHSVHHAPDRDALHEVPAPFDPMTPAFPSTNVAPSRRNRRGAARRRRNSQEMERDLKAQLEQLKREHEVLAAEKMRLQHVTTLMEQEVQRRKEEDQRLMMRALDPTRDLFR